MMSAERPRIARTPEPTPWAAYLDDQRVPRYVWFLVSEGPGRVTTDLELFVTEALVPRDLCRSSYTAPPLVVGRHRLAGPPPRRCAAVQRDVHVEVLSIGRATSFQTLFRRS